MAGSVRHIIKDNGHRQIQGGRFHLIDDLGDAHEAFQEFYDLFLWMSDDSVSTLAQIVEDWEESRRRTERTDGG